MAEKNGKKRLNDLKNKIHEAPRGIEKSDDTRMDLMNMSTAASEHFMLEAGFSSLFDKQNFNTTMWYMMMKNIHGWRDKTESIVEQKSEVKLTVDEANL